MHRSLLPAVALVAMLCLPGAAHAKWDPVTTPGASNTDEVGLLRTPDNQLHVAWRRQPDATSYELDHTVIAPDGAVGAAQVIASGWAGDTVLRLGDVVRPVRAPRHRRRGPGRQRPGRELLRL
jgi:hypothetical protein